MHHRIFRLIQTRTVRLICCCLAWLLVPHARDAAAGELALRSAMESIADDDVRRHLNLLADDTLEGREAGSRGGRAAGIYLVKQLQKLNVSGGGDKGSHFQSFGNSRNVLGLIEGSDPALKEQVVVISAHYDHVGYGNQSNSYGPFGRIHNGADDNASGTSGLLEVVEAVTRLPAPPKRTILFAFWDGEEAGLLGSQHWVNEPTVPLDRIKAMINADMIGRLRKDRVEVYGTRSFRGVRELLSRQNMAQGLLLDFNWEMRADSDHWTFFNRNIPVLMVHTGLHDDYHRPSDDVEKIDIAGVRKVAQLMFSTVCAIADEPQLPRFRGAARHETPNTKELVEQPLPPAPGRLGVRWDNTATDDSGVRLTTVTPGSPAARAGLKPGDRILRIAGQEVRDGDHFRELVLTTPSPAAFSVERAAGAEPVDVKVTLTGSPVRVGLTWRTDDAEPGAVIVTRVVPGSPADQAGVRNGERIYSVADQSFKTSDQFRDLVTTLPGPLAMEVERAGRMRSVLLHLPGEPTQPAADAASIPAAGEPVIEIAPAAATE